MPGLEPSSRRSRVGTGKLAVLTLAGTAAAAWVWNRRNEDTLRQRTERRLRPLSGDSAS